MTRHRARPSFTVEVKRTRNTPLGFHEDPDRQRAAQSLWKGTALAEAPTRAHVLEAAFAVSAPAPAVAAKGAVKSPVGGAAPARPFEAPSARRVLPSLIEAAKPELEPEPAVEVEAPLPRVRRLSERVRAPKPERAATPPRAPDPVVPQPPPAPAIPPAPVPRRAETADELPRRRSRYGEKSELRAGERWKARLPRVCW